MAPKDLTRFDSSACFNLALNIAAHLDDMIADVVVGAVECTVDGSPHEVADYLKDVSLS